MSLKDFCVALQQCAQKLEEEVKINLNDLMNKLYSHSMSETKMSLEKAKDYHYKEIVEALGEVLRQIKRVLFHQDQIEWLNHEENFTKDELRRFSYVKRQVYAFSKTDDVPVPPVKRRQRRRTTSEVSVGSLDDWEKYLDQKEQEESQIAAKAEELKLPVSRRTLSNARRRKKFVSSTQIGFLEDGSGGKDSLDSILEDDATEFEANSSRLNEEEPNRLAYKSTLSNDKRTRTLVASSPTEFLDDGNGGMDSLDSILEDDHSSDEEKGELAASNDNVLEPTVASSDKESDDSSRVNEDLNVRGGAVSSVQGDTKPRIVDVIYKNRLA